MYKPREVVFSDHKSLKPWYASLSGFITATHVPNNRITRYVNIKKEEEKKQRREKKKKITEYKDRKA